MNKLYSINKYSMDERASEFILPCNHTQDQRHWFHTHTSCYLLSHEGSWYSSCSPSGNVFLKSNDYICSMCNVFQIEEARRNQPQDLSLCFYTLLFALESLPIWPKWKKGLLHRFEMFLLFKVVLFFCCSASLDLVSWVNLWWQSLKNAFWKCCLCLWAVSFKVVFRAESQVWYTNLLL